MSTLNVTNISDGTNSTSTTNVVKGSAKAWVNFNGTGTVAIREAYNVGSITDNGTGDYTVNFTTALEDANYATSGITAIGNFVSQHNSTAPAAGSCRFRNTDHTGTAIDHTQQHITFHR